MEGELSPAELRKRRLKAKSEERMAKILNSYGAEQDTTATITASVDTGRARATLVLEDSSADPATGSSAVATLSGDATEPAAPTPPAVEKSKSDAAGMPTEPVADPGAAACQGSEQDTAQPDVVLTVNAATAVQAAAFNLMPFRVGCALCVALVAVSEAMDAPLPVSHLISVILANLALILSSAWMLTKAPRTCKRILRQIQLRGGASTSTDWCLSLLARVAGAPTSPLKVLLALAWSAYVDSGTYIAAVVILYVLRSGPGELVGRGAVSVPDPDMHLEL